MVEIPNRLKEIGIRFVLLEKESKKPIQKDWTKLNIEYDDPLLISHLKYGGNYGVMGGGSKKLLIVDFDNEKVQEECLSKLPKTFMVKTGSGKLHLYYFSDRCESFKIFDEEMNTLVDIQGEGKQVVGAGSKHPNGTDYVIFEDNPVATIPYSELKAIMMPYDKKPRKEKQAVLQFKEQTNSEDTLLEEIKSKVKVRDVLGWFGIDTSKNPTSCPFHSSAGGHCLGFEDDYCHCFHCEGSWNIFSLVKQEKNYSFREALEWICDKAGMKDNLQESRERYIQKQRESEEGAVKDLKFKFLSCINEKEIGSATELLVDYILKQNHIYTTKDDNKSELWIYKEGVYIPNGKCEIKETLRRVLGDTYNQFYYNNVLAKIEADTFIDTREFFSHNYVNEVAVQNGILNIITKELSPFTPDKIFFNKLPVRYNPEAECVLIDQFLSGILAKEDDKKIFYELGGFCLLKEYKFEKAFMFVGDGRNGKDKSLELIKRLLGAENCCSVPLSSINLESFIVSEFFGRLVNLAGDIDNKDLKDTSAFKALTGRSLISGQRKFLNAINFVNYAKFVFACNNLPVVYDMSKGFWDRWVLLEYPYTFVSQSEYDSATDKTKLKIRDPDIIAKITTPEEMEGLLNAFLEGLHRLIEKGSFSTTAGSEEVKSMWVRKANSFMAFCMDCLEGNYDSWITKKELRKRYHEYCTKYKLVSKNDLVIKRTLEELFGVSEGYRGTMGISAERTWEGIKFRG